MGYAGTVEGGPHLAQCVDVQAIVDIIVLCEVPPYFQKESPSKTLHESFRNTMARECMTLVLLKLFVPGPTSPRHGSLALDLTVLLEQLFSAWCWSTARQPWNHRRTQMPCVVDATFRAPSRHSRIHSIVAKGAQNMDNP